MESRHDESSENQTASSPHSREDGSARGNARDSERRRAPSFSRVASEGVFDSPHTAHDANPAAARRIEDLEARLRELEAKLEQDALRLCHADRLMTLGTLSAGVVHELKNPLGAISGFCQLGSQMISALRPGGDDPAGDDEYSGLTMCLEEIARNVEVMQGILDNLRSFSRKDAGTMGPTLLSATVSDALKILSFKLHGGSGITFGPRGEECLIFGNANRLVQVWTNILSNAFDAIAERGKSDPGFTGRGHVDVSVDVRDGYATVEIRDNGIGMPPEVRDKLFTPFFTTKKESEGTGLGLSIVAQILREHNAGIEVESEPGQGTVFRVRFPATGQ